MTEKPEFEINLRLKKFYKLRLKSYKTRPFFIRTDFFITGHVVMATVGPFKLELVSKRLGPGNVS